jgi:tight adherence protein C
MSINTILGILLFLGAAGFAGYTFFGKKKEATITTEELIGKTHSESLRDAVMAQSAKDRALPALQNLLTKLRKLSPAGWVESTEMKISMSSMTHWSVERVIATKIGGLIFGLLFVYTRLPIKGKVDWICLLVMPPLGFFLADILISNSASKRQTDIQRSLPDILDQVTIGVEAGLGFDSALSRAAKSNTGPLAEEISRTLAHVTAGLSRAEAMRGLASRSKVPELRQFVGAILQAEQYGIPMAQVLRVQAAEQRRKRRQRAEEKAMKIPVKVLFPLVLCILPALFIVLVGPAGLKMAESF